MSPRASKLVVTAALAMALPASAQAVVLHDQTSPVGSHEISSEAFDTPSSFHDSQVADDFTVPRRTELDPHRLQRDRRQPPVQRAGPAPYQQCVHLQQ